MNPALPQQKDSYATNRTNSEFRHGSKHTQEALKSALYKPMSLVLARKNLDLEIEPTRVYATVLEELRFKSDSDLTADVTPQQAWALPEVRAIILPPLALPYP